MLRVGVNFCYVATYYPFALVSTDRGHADSSVSNPVAVPGPFKFVFTNTDSVCVHLSVRYANPVRHDGSHAHCLAFADPLSHFVADTFEQSLAIDH